ncbi:MAG: hypothetical protein IIB29_05685 [Chloroflexi bacterium]|nr:hypothetical protein [Chloroflexota bacterium]
MSYRWWKAPKVILITSLSLLLLAILACGGTAATPIVVEKEVIKEVIKEVVVEKEVIKEVPVEVIVEKEVIKEIIKEVVIAAPRSEFVITAVPREAKKAQTGKLATDKLVAVLQTPTKQSTLDCQVTGSATVNHRPSVEYLLGVDHSTGEIIPMLASSWEASADLRSFKVKLRKGVQFHDNFGEFNAADVVHSIAYYTNDRCKASYSDYFRNNPGTDIEVINDHELIINTVERPALIYDYWLSEYRGVPISSRAQFDQGCPQGSSQYEQGYCRAGTAAVDKNPSRTGPYEYVNFEKGVSWEYDRVTYDHWRVNPDFAELEIKMVKEPATRLAILLAREGNVGSVPRALNQEALDGGLELVDASVEALTTFMIFGGNYFDSSLEAAYDPMPWAIRGEVGKKVRMAMNKALDRDKINEAIFDGQGSKQWVASLHPAFDGYYPAWDAKWEELYGYDPERAKELLVEAGFPNGFEVREKLFVLSGVPEQPDFMEAAAGMWEAIGLQPKLEEVEFSRWREKYRGLETQCCVYPFRGPAAPIATRVHFYFSPERFFRAAVTDTITENKNIALNTTDPKVASSRWKAVADELYFEVLTMPLFTLPVQAVIDPEVISEYIFLGPPGGSYNNLENIKGVRN